jgi:hypothetical protein
MIVDGPPKDGLDLTNAMLVLDLDESEMKAAITEAIATGWMTDNPAEWVTEPPGL